MAGNLENKVETPLERVTGPIPGENLLKTLKEQMILEPVFQTMFGSKGEHIFIDKVPAINESILPAIYFSWASENFKSMDVYMDGFLNGTIFLPVHLTGDFNALRKVGNIIQRWMGGPMSLFQNCPGLTQFGFGTDFGYDQLAKMDGLTLPMITLRIPFRFDLQLMQLQTDGFDPTLPLDDSDVGFIESLIYQVTDSETNNVLVPEGKIY